MSNIKKEAIKLFGRSIPFYPDTKIIGNHHIRGGSPSIFISTIFRGKLKVQGLPPLMWWILFFLRYFSIWKSLFQTISCNLFQNQRKIEKVVFFFKKLPFCVFIKQSPNRCCRSQRSGSLSLSLSHFILYTE